MKILEIFKEAHFCSAKTVNLVNLLNTGILQSPSKP